MSEEFRQTSKEDKDRKEGVNQGSGFTYLFSDRETQPAERDRQLDEAYNFITERIDTTIFDDLEQWE